MSAYEQWARGHNSLLVVTWDEDDGSATNHVPTLISGAESVLRPWAVSVPPMPPQPRSVSVRRSPQRPRVDEQLELNIVGVTKDEHRGARNGVGRRNHGMDDRSV
jgi:hypothetical protein